MPQVAGCPACGSALTEAAVLALAPVCGYCKSVLINVGGTLGLTGAYGVSDPTITRKRLDADIRVVEEYMERYRDMIAASHEELAWGVDRYADLPPDPELLSVDTTLPGKTALVFPILTGITYLHLTTLHQQLTWIFGVVERPTYLIDQYGIILGFLFGLFLLLLSLVLAVSPFILVPAVFASGIAFVAYLLGGPRRARAQRENSSRLLKHRQAATAALSEAEPKKRAQDHRLRLRIREAEANLETLTSKVAELRSLRANV